MSALDSTDASDSATHDKPELDGQRTLVPKAELDTQPSTLAELGSGHVGTEVDTQPNTLAELPSIIAELDSTCTPGELDVTSDLNRSVSLVTSSDDRRSSAVSSLAPLQDHRPLAGASPMGAALQVVGQQHSGSNDGAQSNSASQKDARRSHGYQSGMLPLLEATQKQSSMHQQEAESKSEENALDETTAQPGKHLVECEALPEDVNFSRSEESMQGDIEQEIRGRKTADDEYTREDRSVHRDEDLHEGQHGVKNRATTHVEKAAEDEGFVER